MLLVCSCSALVYLQMCVCIILHTSGTCCAAIHRVSVQTGGNGDQVELSILSNHCQTGWFQFWPPINEDTPHRYNRTGDTIVCKRCSTCIGVRVLSPCTQTNDVECSKLCHNPELIYHESTKSCGDEFMDNTLYGLDITGDEQPGGIMGGLEGLAYEQGDFRIENTPFLNNNVQRKETIKDPNVLFVASAVIFFVLLLMISPQAINKFGKWLQRHGLYGNRDTGTSIERTFDVNGTIAPHHLVNLTLDPVTRIDCNEEYSNETCPSTSKAPAQFTSKKPLISDSDDSDLGPEDDIYEEDDSDNATNELMGQQSQLQLQLIDHFSDPQPNERLYGNDTTTHIQQNTKHVSVEQNCTNDHTDEQTPSRKNSPRPGDRESNNTLKTFVKDADENESKSEQDDRSIQFRDQDRWQTSKTVDSNVVSITDSDGGDQQNHTHSTEASKIDGNVCSTKTTMIGESHLRIREDLGYDTDHRKSVMEQSMSPFLEPPPPEIVFEEIHECTSDAEVGVGVQRIGNIKDNEQRMDNVDSGAEDDEADENTPLNEGINYLENVGEIEFGEATPLSKCSTCCNGNSENTEAPNALYLKPCKRSRHDSGVGVSPDFNMNDINWPRGEADINNNRSDTANNTTPRDGSELWI